MKITIIHKFSGLRLFLRNEKSEVAFREISNALKHKTKTKTLGLLSPDLEIRVKDEKINKIYFLYDRGYIIMDPRSRTFYPFEYGNIWYQSIQEKLNDILQTDPEYFLHPKTTIVRAITTTRISPRKSGTEYIEKIREGLKIKSPKKLETYGKIAATKKMAAQTAKIIVLKGVNTRKTKSEKIAKKESKMIKKAAAKKK